LDDAVSKCFGKYHLFCDMVGCLFDEAAPLLERMRAALAGGDAAELADVAHRLKGTVGYLGAATAFEAVRRVEQIGRTGALADAPEAIDQLEEQLNRLEEALLPHHKNGQVPT
jgi:protein-histidine pros-kinase